MKFDERRWRVFGNWLKDRRRYEHLSQEATAREAAMSRRHFIRIEQGKIEVPAETVRRLARAVTAPEDRALVRAGYTPSPLDFDLETRVKQIYRHLLEDDLVSAIQQLLDDYSLLSQKRAGLKSPDKWKMSIQLSLVLSPPRVMLAGPYACWPIKPSSSAIGRTSHILKLARY